MDSLRLILSNIWRKRGTGKHPQRQDNPDIESSSVDVQPETYINDPNVNRTNGEPGTSNDELHKRDECDESPDTNIMSSSGFGKGTQKPTHENGKDETEPYSAQQSHPEIDPDSRSTQQAETESELVETNANLIDTDSDLSDNESYNTVEDKEYTDSETIGVSSECSQQIEAQSSATEVQTPPSNIKCKKHIKFNVTHVCRNCRVAVCSVCIKRKHVNHNCKCITESSAILAKMLEAERSNVECIIVSMQDTIEGLTETKEELVNVHQENITDVKEREEQFISDIQIKSEDAIETITQYMEQECEPFETNIVYLTELASSTERELPTGCDTDDPISLLEAHGKLLHLGSKCKSLLKRTGDIGRTTPLYYINPVDKIRHNEHLEKCFDIASISCKSSMHTESLLSLPTDEAEHNGVCRTPLPLLTAFESDKTIEVGKFLEKGNINIIMSKSCHQVYKLAAEDCLSIEPLSVNSASIVLRCPIIINDVFVCHGISSRKTNHYTTSKYILIYFCKISDKQLSSFEVDSSIPVKGVSYFAANEIVFLQQNDSHTYLQYICIKTKKSLESYQLHMSDGDKWKFSSPVLVKSDKTIILFSSNGNVKRIQIYDQYGRSGKTIPMPDEMLKHSQTAIIDDTDQIWIFNDKGQIKRFSLRGSETFCLEIGKQIHHMMTDGTAMYVHYFDDKDKRRFEKIDLKESNNS